MQFLRCQTCLPASTEASMAAELVSFGTCRCVSIERTKKITALIAVPITKKRRVPRVIMDAATLGIPEWRVPPRRRDRPSDADPAEVCERDPTRIDGRR